MTHDWNDGERWQARKWAAWSTRAFVFLAPIAAAILAATFLARALPEATTVGPIIGWWAAVIGGSYVASNLTSRAAARLLPLAALLNMSLVFPDEAPSRFKVALRSGSTGLLRKEVERAIAAGADDDPTRSAEFALTLVSSLGKHDRTTRGHAERTRAYTDLIAEELELIPSDRDRLRWASLLHDIGKIEIDRDILQKDKPLDEGEWDAIREHPRAGYEMTAPIREFLGPWAQTILHHHERFDGMGYPTGVAADDIALGARIVSVADAYDAMTAARSYQTPMSRKDALAELTDGAGTQFDPAVVRAFLRVGVRAMRRVAGPWVVLAQLPFIGGLRRVADSATVVAASAAGVLFPLVAGLTPVPTPDPNPVVAAAPATTLAPGTTSPGGSSPPSATNVPGGSVPQTTPPQGTLPPNSGPPSSTTIDPTATTTTAVPGATTTSTTISPTTTSSTTTTSTTTTSTTTTTGVPTSTTTSTTTTSTTSLPPAPPNAVGDTAATDEDEPVLIDVLANDSDPNGDLDTASLRVLLQGAMGQAGVVANHGGGSPAISYSPDADVNGSDGFEYEICDLGGRCSAATVTVSIAAVNDPPTAVPDSAATNLLTPVEIDVLANDWDVDGGPLTIVDHDDVSVQGGTIKCTSTCVYTPPVVWLGSDSFNYTVADEKGATAATSVTVTPVIPDRSWYLRSSGPGDVSSVPRLPLTIVPGPNNGGIANYDIDRDGDYGLLLRRAGSGISEQLLETDPTRHQLWAVTVEEDTHLLGTGRISLFGGMRDLAAGIDGRVRVFLLDCPSNSNAGSDCSTIGIGTVTRRPWSVLPGVWVGFTADLGSIDYPIGKGRLLVVKLVVSSAASDDDMWFAYDATGLISAVRILGGVPDLGLRALRLR